MKGIDAGRKMLVVDGLNVATFEITELRLYYASISNTNLIDGSYYARRYNYVKEILSSFFERSMK